MIIKGLKVKRKKAYYTDEWIKVCSRNNKLPNDIFTIKYINNEDIRLEEFSNSLTWFLKFFDIVKPKKDHFPTWW